MGWPFSVSAVQVPPVVMLSHQLPDGQSPSTRQTAPHAPVALLQNGNESAHARLAPLPAFPLQAAQALVAASQMGVAPPQSALPVHWPQTAGPPTSGTQKPLRQSLAATHGPLPSARPQRLSDASHTAAVHARAASVGTQVPPGIISPLDVLGVQMAGAARSLHQFPAPQSESLAQEVPHAPVGV
jgi:hypothetical protein